MFNPCHLTLPFCQFTPSFHSTSSSSAWRVHLFPSLRHKTVSALPKRQLPSAKRQPRLHRWRRAWSSRSEMSLGLCMSHTGQSGVEQLCGRLRGEVSGVQESVRSDVRQPVTTLEVISEVTACRTPRCDECISGRGAGTSSIATLTRREHKIMHIILLCFPSELFSV